MLSYYQKIVRPAFLCALLFGAVSICVFAITLSPSYQSCISENNHSNTNNKQEEFRSHIGLLIYCEAGTLNDNTGALTALGTLAIAFFTLTLWLVTDKALRLARDEFNATHRPKLVFREIRLHPQTATMIAAQFSFVILNTGESPCEIVESRIAGLEDMGDGQGITPLGAIENRNPIGPIKLKGGQRWPSQRWDVAVPTQALINGHNQQRALPEESPIKRFWFRANVTYRGADGTDRRTSVCRWYDFRSQSFRTDEANEFEYAD